MGRTHLPNFVTNYEDHGSLDVDSVEIPKLKLLQAWSPELREFDGAQRGEFWHGVIGERLGSVIRVCPIYIDTRFILWRPATDGGGILARADDGKHWKPANTEFTVKIPNGRQVTWRTADTVKASGLDRRGSHDRSDPNSPSAATRMYSIVCAFPEQQDLSPAVLVLQGEAVKAATGLIGKLKSLRAPSFGVILELSSFKDRSSSGDFYNCTFSLEGPVADRTLYEEYFAQYRFFIEHGLKINKLEEAQEERRHDDAGDAGA